ncbi:MAG: mycothiol system anti-sigma-R factor [Actinobacteria bacterium]|nr:mycothiol system anti-sigma-R factor [Actinomycetota bacterium]MBI3686651.1 mycothiol system anti-sigma-R factor [Actinomycetota bacterium]
MSCGSPHKMSCSDVIAEVFLFIDGEATEQRRALIHRHLDECSPCLREYGIEEEVKALVHRTCGGDRAPESLRQRVRVRLSEVVMQLRTERQVGTE